MDEGTSVSLNLIVNIIVGFAIPFIYPISQVLMHLILASLILAIVFGILERKKDIGDYIVKFLLNLFVMFMVVLIAVTIHSFLDPDYLDSGSTTGGRYRYYII